MQGAANSGLDKQNFVSKHAKRAFANRYLGTFQLLGFLQNSCRKKMRKREARVFDLPPVCRMISAWLREQGLPLQVMSFQRVLHVEVHSSLVNYSEDSKRLRQRSAGTPQRLSTSQGGACGCVFPPAGTCADARHANTAFQRNIYVLHYRSKITARDGSGARTHSGVPRGGLKLKLYSSEY